ncbi:MAG: hypothetical protein ACPHN2_04805 [Sinimarinibacterium flocculans]|uniref:hypothetical protein n=1 Tax=Sinimarinibacterium flocculans TaxID=985250 RepID=UPI003C403B4E
MITVSADPQTQRRVAVSIDAELRREARIALTAGVQEGRRWIIERVHQRYNLPRGYIAALFSVSPAKATADGLEARIVARRRNVQLRRFGARQAWMRGKNGGRKRGGVSVEVVRGQRRTIHSAFLAPQRAGKIDGAGGLAVFRRENFSRGGARYPIEALYGVSPVAVFANSLDDVGEISIETTRARLTLRLNGGAP